MPRWSTAITWKLSGQRRHHQTPGVPGLGPAVHQQQRRAVAADHGVQAHVTGVDVATGEGVGEAGRKVGCAGDGSGSVRGWELG